MTLSRLFLVALFIGGLLYIFHKGHQAVPPPPPPPPPILSQPPPLVLREAELEKIRAAAADTDPTVRMAAMNLLYRIHDPNAVKIAQKTLALDTETSVRRQALGLLKDSGHNPEVTKNLVGALKDSEKEIRMAALMALSDLAEPATVPDVARLLSDIEPDVRIQALQTLNNIQDKIVQRFRAEQAEEKRRYDEAIQKYNGQIKNPFDHLRQIQDQP